MHEGRAASTERGGEEEGWTEQGEWLDEHWRRSQRSLRSSGSREGDMDPERFLSPCFKLWGL